MSELKDYKPETIRKHWNDKVRKALIGKKITHVEYLSKEEVDDAMWYKTPIAICLDNKYWLIPMADDEGNDGGSISVNNMKELDVIPTI